MSVRTLLHRVAVARTRDEHSGSVTPFVLIVTIALFMLGGLVIDGGRQLNSKSRAIAYAQEASRAGATAVDVTKDRAIVDKDDARLAATRFCEHAMSQDDDLVACVPDIRSADDTEGGAPVYDVQVETTVKTDAILSGMFGVNTWTADGLARARPVQGVTDLQAGQDQTMDPPTTRPPHGNPFTTGDSSEPPENTLSQCPSPYDDPYDPRDPWTKGEEPEKPSPTYQPGTDDDPFCWPPWTPPPPKDKDPKHPHHPTTPPDTNDPTNGGNETPQDGNGNHR